MIYFSMTIKKTLFKWFMNIGYKPLYKLYIIMHLTLFVILFYKSLFINFDVIVIKLCLNVY